MRDLRRPGPDPANVVAPPQQDNPRKALHMPSPNLVPATGMQRFPMKRCKVMQNPKSEARPGGPAARLVERHPMLQNDHEESRGTSEEGPEGARNLTCWEGLEAQWQIETHALVKSTGLRMPRRGQGGRFKPAAAARPSATARPGAGREVPPRGKAKRPQNAGNHATANPTGPVSTVARLGMRQGIAVRPRPSSKIT